MDDYGRNLDSALRRADGAGAASAAVAWAKSGKGAPREIAIEIAKTVGAAYRDFVIDPVHEFIDQCEGPLGPEIGPVVVKAVGRLINITTEWEGRVRACYEERLARELRDFVRVKDWHSALHNIGALCKTVSGSEEEVRTRAIYVGNVLGTLLNHPKEAEHVIRLVARDPGSYGLTVPLAAEMSAAREQRHGQMLGANLENIENQWSQTLKGAQVELLNLMPNKNKMGEPEEEDLRNVGDAFRSILRVPLWQREPEMLLEATLLLVDFSPKDLAFAAKVSGIEGRAYNELGFRAKKTVAHVFMDIGKNSFFTDLYQQWAKPRLTTAQADQIVEFMGALRCEKYTRFFMDLWDTKQGKEMRGDLAVALGNLASPEAGGLLLEEMRSIAEGKATGLGDHLKRLNEFKTSDKSLSAGQVRQIEVLLQGLGRIVRSPRADENTRKQIIQKAIEIAPQDNLRVRTAVAMELLAAKPDALKEKELKWAIDTLVGSLWVVDQKTAMHRGSERQTSLLGDREGAAKALKALGKADPDTLIQSLDKYCTRYSAAYLAAAEILQELKLEKALPVLERMFLNGLMHTEGAGAEYQKETYWDTATQSRKEFSKDQVVAPLVFAMGTIGGEESHRILKQIQTQIASGRMPSPGAETVEYLTKFVGIPKKAELQAAESGTPLPASATASAIAEYDPGEVKKLIKALTGSYFLQSAEKRRAAKIAALIKIGQSTPEEALDAVIENLADKDALVASAAITTVAEFGAVGKQGYMIEQVLNKVFDCMEHKEPLMRHAAPKILKEMGLHRPEIKKRVFEFAKSVRDNQVKLNLKMLLESAAAQMQPPKGEGGPAMFKDKKDEHITGEEDWESAKLGSSGSALDTKRRYVLARQAWVKGGKKGDPPKAPEGM